jgi:hypothetical protein
MEFFNTCEAGEGWEACKQYCHDGATFSCQADALADVTSVEGYTEWVKGLLTPIPDMRPDIRGFGVDDGRNTAVVYSVVHGTQSGDGPVPPTGKTLAADYVYAMEFDGDKIRHMTKIWNDVHSLRQLGWA